jgi:hypothetical protein
LVQLRDFMSQPHALPYNCDDIHFLRGNLRATGVTRIKSVQHQNPLPNHDEKAPIRLEPRAPTVQLCQIRLRSGMKPSLLALYPPTVVSGLHGEQAIQPFAGRKAWRYTNASHKTLLRPAVMNLEKRSVEPTAGSLASTPHRRALRCS